MPKMTDDDIMDAINDLSSDDEDQPKPASTKGKAVPADEASMKDLTKSPSKRAAAQKQQSGTSLSFSADDSMFDDDDDDASLDIDVPASKPAAKRAPAPTLAKSAATDSAPKSAAAAPSPGDPSSLGLSYSSTPPATSPRSGTPQPGAAPAAAPKAAAAYKAPLPTSSAGPCSPIPSASLDLSSSRPDDSFASYASDAPPAVASRSAVPPGAASPAAFSIPASSAATGSNPLLRLEQERQAAAAAAAKAAASKPKVSAQDVDAAGLSSKDVVMGLDLPSPLQLFMQYDTDRSSAVRRDEFKQMLYDLDGLQEIPKREADAYVNHEFDEADLNHDGVISIDEFFYYYYKELCFKFPVLRTGVNPGADLFNIFIKYCSFGKPTRSEELGSNGFARLCKDSKLISDRVKKADIDIIYSRARAETEVLEVFKARPGAEWTTAKMYYNQFLYALMKLSEKRRSGFQEVVGRILGNVSAVPQASQADFLVFRNTGDPAQLAEWVERPRGLPRLPRVANDASERLAREAALAQSLKLPSATAMGAHLKSFMSKQVRVSAPGADAGLDGAPSSSVPPSPSPGAARGLVDMYATAIDEEQQELPEVKAFLATADQKKKWGLEEYGSAESLGLPCTGRQALHNPTCLLAVRKLNPDHMMMALKRAFERYNMWQCGVNKSSMDKTRWSKALRDALLVHESGPLPAAAADKIFGRLCGSTKNAINFIEFVEGLRHVATVMRVSLNEIMEKVVLINAPLKDIA